MSCAGKTALSLFSASCMCQAAVAFVMAVHSQCLLLILHVNMTHVMLSQQSSRNALTMQFMYCPCASICWFVQALAVCQCHVSILHISVLQSLTLVGALVMLMSPQVHPFDFAALCNCLHSLLDSLTTATFCKCCNVADQHNVTYFSGAAQEEEEEKAPLNS